MMGKNGYVISLLMVLTSVILWGFSFIWSKQLLNEINSITIILARTFIASVVLIAIGKISGYLKLVPRKDVPYFILIALVQPFLYFIFELTSIKYNSPTLTALIIAQIPLFIAIINFLVNRKRITLTLLLGIIISLAGVGMVLMCGGDISIIATPFGIGMSIAAMACAIAYNFLVQKIVDKYNPITITTYIHVIGFLLFIPMFFVFDYASLEVASLGFNVLYPLIMLGLFCSAVAFLFYIFGIKYLGITVSSMINNLSPAVTAIGMFWILDEKLSLMQIVGIGITLLGLTVGLIKKDTK